MASFGEFLSMTFFGNTGGDYLTAAGIFVALFVIFLVFDKYVIVYLKRKSAKTKFEWDDLATDFLNAIHWQFYAFIAFYVSTLSLTISETPKKILGFLLIVFVAYYVAQGFSRVVDYFTKRQLAKRKNNGQPENTSMIKVFGVLFKVVLYVVIFLMALANLGIEITPLIASLGIGGIAIAIALQSVLADLFAAFAIYFDKPFNEGDFIIVGNDMGTVKQIGIKTTRIQTLQGQELSISNSDLTNSRVNNYKRMTERRVVFKIGVEYSTSTKKLKRVNEIIKKSVETTKNARFDRTHFFEFGDFSLMYEIVYYVKSPDYSVYMDTQQEINFKIREAFEKEKIVFAFPTQTIHVDSFKK